jgi:hypothetical protein
MFVGCGAGSDVATVDPDVRRTVETFWEAFSSPYVGSKANGPPNLKNAYEQLHQEAKGRQTLKEFNRQWTEWVQRQSPGWVSGAEIASAEVAADSATVVVKLSFEQPGIMEPMPTGEASFLRMTLQKEGATWAVFSVEEEASSGETDR